MNMHAPALEETSESDLFEAALLEAESRRDAAAARLASIPRVAAPVDAVGFRLTVASSSSRPATLEAPGSSGAFLDALGFVPRTPEGRSVRSFEAHGMARAHVAGLVRQGLVGSAPCVAFARRPGLGAASASERQAAFVGSPSASRTLCDALGVPLGSEGSPVLPKGPRRIPLLPFCDRDALERMRLEYGSSSMFEHASARFVAPPFLMYHVAQRRFVFVDCSGDPLEPFLVKAGFRRHPDSSWTTASPSAANVFRRFADPGFRALIEGVYARWPFIDDGFTLDDLEKAVGNVPPGSGSSSRRKEKERPDPRLSYDAPSGLFYTRDAALAVSAGFDALDPRDVSAIAVSAGFERKALFGSAFLSAVVGVRDEADDGAETEIVCRLIEEAAKPALPASWTPPAPAAGFAYDGDQVDGIRHAMRGPVISIADDMGIGKSFEAAGLIDSVRREHASGSPMVLYVLPASQRDSITAVLAAVPGGEPFRVRRIDGCGLDPRPANVAVVAAGGAPVPAAGGVIVVASYETLVNERSLLGVVWDLVVFDESHLIKNVDAERTAAVIDPVGDAGIRALRVVFMSGTQITNTMSDYWPMLRLLLRRATPSRSRFKALFAGRPNALGEEDPVKMARVARFAKALDSGIRIRRTKEELGKTPGKLPPTIVVVPVSDPGVVREAGREVDLYESLQGISDAREAVRIKREINAIRKETALAKVPFLVWHLGEVARREPIVVFTHHVEVAEVLGDALAASGLRIAVLTGRRTGPAERHALVEAFQRGEYDGIVGTMSCAGVGYTMTRSAYCGVVELDWKAHIVAQAPDRLDRRGQTRKVALVFFVIERSFDSVVARGIVAKSRLADVANGDDARRLRSAVQAVSAFQSGVEAFANSASA